MKSYISLEDVRFYAHHGAYEQEQCVGNWFEVTVRVQYDFTDAMDTDNLEGTIDYGQIYDLVKAEMDIPSKLIEHVAGRIVKALRKKFPATILPATCSGRIVKALRKKFPEIKSGYLKVSKMKPPINAPMHCAAVEVEW